MWAYEFKKYYFRVELMFGDRSQGSYVEPADKPLELDLEADSYRITLVRMTKRQYRELPEFTGF
jgi:hypothetical protein